MKTQYHNPQLLLPWYLNDTLSADERRAVEDWLLDDPQAQVQLDAWWQVRFAAEAQPQQAPSPAVKQRLLARVRAATKARHFVSRRHLAWAWGAAMALAVLVLLVATIQPGIGLQWSLLTEDAAVVAFRVYRAPAGAQLGKANFGLLVEVPARSGMRSYTYVDTRLVPGQSRIRVGEHLEKRVVDDFLRLAECAHSLLMLAPSLEARRLPHTITLPDPLAGGSGAARVELEGNTRRRARDT